jgi:nucleotide-binding universal stress UspA family protein
LIERSRQEAEEAMAAFLKGHGATAPSITPRLERDEIVPGVSRLVLEQDADLLALGTHGRTGIVGALTGSVALTFLSNPPCDLLVSG